MLTAECSLVFLDFGSRCFHTKCNSNVSEMRRAPGCRVERIENTTIFCVILYPMSFALVPHEEAAIRAFIVRERRERFLELLPNPKHRHKIAESLAHPNPAWFESHCVKPIPPSQSSGLCCKFQARTEGVRDVAPTPRGQAGWKLRLSPMTATASASALAPMPKRVRRCEVRRGCLA
jgi:hypothetical protein